MTIDSRYPNTVEALIDRIKMDACPGMGDLSSQCCASLDSVVSMLEENRKLKTENSNLRDLAAELEYLDSEAKQGAELAEDEISYLKTQLSEARARIAELEAALSNGGLDSDLDEYQKFDQELCRDVFEKLDAEFDKDPTGGITVYTEDWRAAVHHLKHMQYQKIGNIGGANAKPSVPEGWKLVPMESTSTMDIAGMDYINESYGDNVIERDDIDCIWQAMIAAAPQPPQEGE